jgi:hypothetical protein
MKKQGTEESVKKPFNKKWWFGVIVVICIIGSQGCSDESASKDNAESIADAEEKDICLYDNQYVTINNLMNASHTDKLGEYSIIKVKSTDITAENLADWYYNYVSVNNYNWCMILYTDKDDNSGIYSVKGIVETDVIFEHDKYDAYMLGDDSNATYYTTADDNTLKVSE